MSGPLSVNEWVCKGLNLWRTLRRITGDDAYTRYLEHFERHHAADGCRPMTQKAFTAQELERRWNGIRRCC